MRILQIVKFKLIANTYWVGLIIRMVDYNKMARVRLLPPSASIHYVESIIEQCQR